MKKIILAALLLCGAIRTGAQAPGQEGPGEPYRVEVAFDKTVHILFPSAVKYVDLGSANIIAGKADGAENVVRVKAAVRGFTGATSFTVITASGVLYTFEALYADSPAQLTVELEDWLHKDPYGPFASRQTYVRLSELGDETPLVVNRIMYTIYKRDARHIKTVGSKRFGVQLLLKGIYVQDELFYFHTSLRNLSNVDYDIDRVRFRIADRKVAKRMMAIARENMKELPSFYGDIVDKRFGGDIDAYVDYLYDNSVFASEEKVMALLEDYAPEKVASDPAVELAGSVMEKYKELTEARKDAAQLYAEGHRKYIAGLMLQNPSKAWASDANFTIRLTYGRVLPYEPADGIEYNYYTTLKGVMEKENPENPEEFTVPGKLKELYAAGDFGRYANAKGEMPVAFLADLDITGGNSGSPVLDARGALIGLAFDGNWEAMSGDVAFEPELQRMIAVDVRYVLFIIDKFAGAGWLLDEMQFE